MKKASKLIKLVHNPTAGQGEYGKKEIISLMKANGYKCSYNSSKKTILDNLDPSTEFIAIAGGDGTIRKVIMKLLNKKLKYKRPIALLPFGTANNIATSLKISNNNDKNISSWNHYHLKKFDVGQIVGLEKTEFFIESFGFGIFPKLMKQLSKANTDHIKSSEDEFELALITLLEISKTYTPFRASIELDNESIENEFLLIEVMNISSIGPHLNLSPNADPGDGYFDVLVVSADKRDSFSSYVQELCGGKKASLSIRSIRTKSLRIFSKCKDLHVDDEVMKKYQPKLLDIKNMDSLLELVVNSKQSSLKDKT